MKPIENKTYASHTSKLIKEISIKMFADRGYLKTTINLWTTRNAKGVIKPIPCPKCGSYLHYNETFNEIFCLNCHYAQALI